VTLEFKELTQQVQAMGAAMAARAQALRDKNELAQTRLHEAAAHVEDIRDKITLIRAAGVEWRGAVPTDEPMDATYPLPAAPTQATLIAADGSQIFPDPHSFALYYLINVGSIVYKHGSRQAPDCYVVPELHYRDEDLFSEGGFLIRPRRIESYRDLAEIERLALLTERINGVPTLTLTDGPLLLYGHVGPAERATFEKDLARYLEQLTQVQRNGALAAGYVDRPRSPWVINTLDLAGRDLPEPPAARLERHDFEGLDDEALFETVVPPSHRSALFAVESAVNQRYEEYGHRVYFFYLNVSANAHPKLARVEMPEWVVARPGAVDCLHALLVHQCGIMDGYPYVLTRAHELAVVTPEDRRQLESMVQWSLLNCGQTAAMSNKARTKELTRSGPRRHHL
jgi:hypothetical protein